MNDDTTARPPRKARARLRADAAGTVVIRMMLPKELAERADRVGGVGQTNLTRLVMRLLDEADREHRATRG